MLNEQATVGPTQIPTVPNSNTKARKHVIGIPKIQYARKVMIAPNYYLPEALITDAAIPYVVSTITKT